MRCPPSKKVTGINWFNRLVRLSHINQPFAGVQALQDVSLTIERGKIYCLIGENGSGKSTLTSALC